jgi:hypothetical protein
MNKLLSLLLLAALLSCKNHKQDMVITVDNPLTQDSINSALKLLDSVASINADALIKHAPDGPIVSDSTVRRPYVVLTDTTIEQLKKAIKTDKMDRKLAKMLFKETKMLDEIFDEGIFSFVSYPFDSQPDAFNEFAISVGSSGEPGNDVYFFKDKRLAAVHMVYHKYGLELAHYKDETGHTVIYYKENMLSGTAMSWNEYCFFRYEAMGTLRAIGRFTADAFIDPGYTSARTRGLDVTVAKTQPLTLKMIFEISLTDKEGIPSLLKDSVLVLCPYIEKLGYHEPDYKKAGVTRAQLASYAPESSGILFLAAYHSLLRQKLADPVQRPIILRYILDKNK